jgi:hypothetical protein
MTTTGIIVLAILIVVFIVLEVIINWQDKWD